MNSLHQLEMHLDQCVHDWRTNFYRELNSNVDLDEKTENLPNSPLHLEWIP
jgi:hypothetical protein